MDCRLRSRYKAVATRAARWERQRLQQTGSDNGDANEAGSMAGSGSLAITRWTQSTGYGADDRVTAK
jgi:hypothetical protein